MPDFIISYVLKPAKLSVLSGCWNTVRHKEIIALLFPVNFDFCFELVNKKNNKRLQLKYLKIVTVLILYDLEASVKVLNKHKGGNAK